MKEFSFLTSDDKGYGGVGAEGIPEDVAEKSKYSGESIKGENEEENANHTIFFSICMRSSLVAVGTGFRSFSYLLVSSGVFFLAPPGSRACCDGTVLLVCLVSNLLP